MTTGDTAMKVNEVIGRAQQSQAPATQPTVVTQQARINSLVQQRVASQAKLPATETEKMQAMLQAADLKQQNDKAYVKRMRQQTAAAERQIRY